ncbi:signaling lymphocytic activation molecule-like [Trachemys scripta elegans]|uniref:signaling lymphocytic activation molecule-like n=1 Tax=Trachemys scripta elegans TaxID=31138 RepID=UPI0015521BC5|nr:signaling lymphocytic activation molecule-like [Trachemys scripta elegans]
MCREMDCSECILLIISFCCAGGTSSESETTVYGSLGGSTLLSITPKFQNFTVQFSNALWKLSVGTKRKLIIRYSGNNYTNHMTEQIKFHPENFSLEILDTKRTDAGHYEYMVNKGSEEEFLHLQLEVYEQVSVPDIQMVSKTLGNESCTMNLSCTVKSGDNVAYSWTCSEGNTSQHPYNDNFLHLFFPPGEGSFSCTCTARNKVSQQITRFSSSVECSNKTGGSLRNELVESIVPIAIVGVLVFGAGVTYWLRHRGQEDHCQLKEEKESCTIYSQVQRVEQQKGSRPPPVVKCSECTTIYASATGLPPDTAQPQDPGLTTIYDSVMPTGVMSASSERISPKTLTVTGGL